MRVRDRTTQTVNTIADCVDHHAFHHPTEDDLQAGIADALRQAGLTTDREVRLSDHDRIDLLVDRVGIEVKTNGSATAAYRQCQRYAHSARLSALVLITTRAAHTNLPPTVGGKPLTVLPLFGRA